MFHKEKISHNYIPGQEHTGRSSVKIKFKHARMYHPYRSIHMALRLQAHCQVNDNQFAIQFGMVIMVDIAYATSYTCIHETHLCSTWTCSNHQCICMHHTILWMNSIKPGMMSMQSETIARAMVIKCSVWLELALHHMIRRMTER